MVRVDCYIITCSQLTTHTHGLSLPHSQLTASSLSPDVQTKVQTDFSSTFLLRRGAPLLVALPSPRSCSSQHGASSRVASRAAGSRSRFQHRGLRYIYVPSGNQVLVRGTRYEVPMYLCVAARGFCRVHTCTTTYVCTCTYVLCTRYYVLVRGTMYIVLSMVPDGTHVLCT